MREEEIRLHAYGWALAIALVPNGHNGGQGEQQYQDILVTGDEKEIEKVPKIDKIDVNCFFLLKKVMFKIFIRR